MLSGRHILKGIRSAIIVFILLVPIDSIAVPYTIDGKISDWNVTLQTQSVGEELLFVQESLIPNPVESIDYSIEDYPFSDLDNPVGGEKWDYEAIYFDDTPGYLYVGAISSHEWNPVEYGTDLCITVYLDGDARSYSFADPIAGMEFAWEQLYYGDDPSLDPIVETLWEDGTWEAYPNYFFEGSLSKVSLVADFGLVGDLPIDRMSVYVWANCGYPRDQAGCWGKCNCPSPVPEPSTMFLLGSGLLGLGLIGRRRFFKKL